METRITIVIRNADVDIKQLGDELEHFLSVGRPWLASGVRVGIGITTDPPTVAKLDR